MGGRSNSQHISKVTKRTDRSSQRSCKSDNCVESQTTDWSRAPWQERGRLRTRSRYCLRGLGDEPFAGKRFEVIEEVFVFFGLRMYIDRLVVCCGTYILGASTVNAGSED